MVRPAWVFSCPLTTPKPGGCDQCGRKLTGRAIRWCSTKCSETFWIQHQWTAAKREAKRRARTTGGFTCARCGDRTREPEVNHKIPCMGKHATNGCHHHQDNLEVLDHECHLLVTAEQRAAGLFKRKDEA